jgi:hypothetical protein
MLDRFDADVFVGVVLDESGILKAYRGKTKEMLCDRFKATPYRLCLSALPAPNDWLELGNHAEFLGVMSSHVMIARWFRNDTMKAGGYVLRPHASDDYWQWVSSWAVCIAKPSDLGFSDEGWDMPPLQTSHHVVAVDHTATWGGDEFVEKSGQIPLIRSATLSATTIHKEMRLNVDEIAAKVAEIIAGDPENESEIIWCFTDYEADALKQAVSGAIDLRGSESIQSKQSKLRGFTDGSIRILITKPEIAGLGLNWQHCAYQTFVMGSSYSFEQYHQALHRTYRFGQTRSVQNRLVYPETAGSVQAAINRKEMQFERMQNALRKAVRKSQLALHLSNPFDDYNPQVEMIVPVWMQSKSA